MPNYTYFCNKCNKSFEKFFSIRDYQEEIKCQNCRSTCQRYYMEDMLTINSSVKKSDSEFKTLGDLANRNRDRMTADHKKALDQKHTEYQDHKLKEELTKELPQGMSRMAKPKYKPKWS